MKNVMKAMLVSLAVMPFFAHATPLRVTNETPWKLSLVVGNNETRQVIMPNNILTLTEKNVGYGCEHMKHRCNIQVIANNISNAKPNNLVGTMVFDLDTGVITVLNPNQGKLVWFETDNGFNVSIKNAR